MFQLFFAGTVIGACATLAMDIWALALSRSGGPARPNWGLVGRWFWHLRTGKLFHTEITQAEAYAHERALGWIAHYAVGIVYGILFLAIVGPGWLDWPSFLPAWIFALLTISAGWFLMQPGMGLGWAASKTPSPWKTRGLGLAAHTAFGLGLWISALLLF